MIHLILYGNLLSAQHQSLLPLLSCTWLYWHQNTHGYTTSLLSLASLTMSHHSRPVYIEQPLTIPNRQIYIGGPSLLCLYAFERFATIPDSFRV